MMDDEFSQFLNEETDDIPVTVPSTRNATIFLVDCTPSMLAFDRSFTPDPQSETGYRLGVECCQLLQQSNAIQAPRDMVALFLMRTATTPSTDVDAPSSGVVSEQPAHFHQIQGLAPADASRILALDAMRDLSEKELSIRFGSCVGQTDNKFSLAKVLWACEEAFRGLPKSVQHKQIYVVTDDSDPHYGQQRLRSQAIVKASDLRQMGIQIDVLPIKRRSAKFDHGIFYQEIVSDAYALDFSNLDCGIAKLEATNKIEELMTRLRSRALHQRCLARLALRLSPDPNMAIGVSVFHLTNPAAKPNPVWLSAATNQPVTARRFYYWASDKERRRPLMPHERPRGLQFAGITITFTQNELKTLCSELAPVGLHLLGFQSITRLQRHHHIRRPQFIYPDETLIHGSRMWFTTLLQVCLDRKLMAIALYVLREGSHPRLVALVPQAEKRDEETLEQLIPSGFHLYFLPYADDYREVELPDSEKASDVQAEAAKSFVRKLMVPYDPRQLANPVLQRHIAILEALALQRESADEVKDYTMPNMEAIKRRAGMELDEFKKLCGIQETAETSVKKPRNSESPLSEGTLREAYQSGSLGKLTVVTLKQAMDLLGLQVPQGTRPTKAVLVEQISSFFNTTA